MQKGMTAIILTCLLVFSTLSAAMAGSLEKIDRQICKDSKLMWYWKQSSKAGSWAAANAYVQGLNSRKEGGFSDWRLPSNDEFGQLISSLDMYRNNPCGMTVEKLPDHLWIGASEKEGQLILWDLEMLCGGNTFSKKVRTSGEGYVLAVRP